MPDSWIVRVFVVVLAAFAAMPVALPQRSTPIQLRSPLDSLDNFQSQFGSSVAIDGDTLIIGERASSVSFPNQGMAHVYRWAESGWVLEATLTASDGAAGDLFGQSVALSGDTAIVGAFLDNVGFNADQGSAYIFTRSGTAWTQQAKLTATNGAADDRFGISVAVSGETAIIGAYRANVDANVDQGSAYIFTRSGTTWTEQATLTAPYGWSYDQFGISVAISGDTAVVGANLGSGLFVQEGAAYVFIRNGNSWTLQATLAAVDGLPLDSFGYDVAICGDTAIVSAPGDDLGANASQGSAYIFVRSNSTWTQQAKLTAGDGAANDNLGTAVALAGDSAIVGAAFDTVSGNANQGSAYVFTRSGTTWSRQATFTAPDGAADDNFGWSVALFGDTGVVGAHRDNVDLFQGSVWIFSRGGSTWIGPDLQLLASDGAALDEFGYAVALSGDTAIVGAFADDVGGNDQGSAYIFVRSGSSWIEQAKLTASDGAALDRFGHSVAVFGDTAIVGAYSDNVGAVNDQGSAYVFVRSGSTWTQQAKLTASDGSANDFFGWSVALYGDFAIVGAYGDNVGSTVDQGSAYIFVRSGSTWSQQAKLTAVDGAANDRLGISVALSGDTAIVGAFFDTVGANANQGSASVFTRSGTTWTQQATLIASDGAASDFFGYSVALSGDTAIVGTYADNVGANIDQGSASIFVRTGTTWSQQATLTDSDGAAQDFFGTAVALSGDTAIVGASGDNLGALTDQGSATVFMRSGTTWTQQVKLTAPDNAAGDRFGVSLAISGDTVIVGAHTDDIGAVNNQGSAWTYDVPADDFARAHNDVTGITYPTLAAALLPATSGQQITATEAAWRGIGSLNTLGHSLVLLSSGDVRFPSSATLELGGSSLLAAAAGGSIDVFGHFLVSPNAFADLTANSFRLGSRGMLTASAGSSLLINALSSDLDGQTSLEDGSLLSFGGGVTAIGPVTANLNSSFNAAGSFTNIDTCTLSNATLTTPLMDNRSVLDVFGSSAIYGDFTNAAGAAATIRSGTLFVFGSLTNHGTLVGTLCSGCSQSGSTLEWLTVDGDLRFGADGNLSLALPGAIVSVSRDYDNAINSNTRYDMALATLRMEGGGPEQLLEAMSRDIGSDIAGLERTLPGHYPIGTLEIGPSPSIVRLVDTRDNDALGQAGCEAIYVTHLRIHAGSRLINTACVPIYYHTLVNDGMVDVPANLIAIGTQPCPGDLNGDLQVDDADFVLFATAYNILDCADPSMPPGCSADLNSDAVVDDADFVLFAAAYDQLVCP